MTRLLVISERLWPEGSGGTLATYLVIKLLAQCKDLNITIVSGTSNPAKIQGVRYIIDSLLRSSNKLELWSRLSNPSTRKRYKDLMQAFDVIYILYTYPLIPLAKKLGKMVIVHLHDYQPVAYNSTILHGQQKGFINDVKAELAYELREHNSIARALLGFSLSTITRLCRLWLCKADTVICVSQRQAEIVAQRAPELKSKIKVVYNPSPQTPQIEEKFEHATLTYAGGGSYVKGFYVFTRAAINLLKKGNKATFLLTGGLRGFKPEQKNMIERLNNALGEFKLLGFLPYEKVLELYSKSYAVIFPSIWEEPLPYVVMEAMAVGTLPIASRVGGIPEIVSGTFAEEMLFRPYDTEGCAGRMEEVLAMSREQIVDVGFSLREAIMKKFDPEITQKKLFSIL